MKNRVHSGLRLFVFAFFLCLACWALAAKPALSQMKGLLRQTAKLQNLNDFQQLIDVFQSDSGKVRLIALLSPT